MLCARLRTGRILAVLLGAATGCKLLHRSLTATLIKGGGHSAGIGGNECVVYSLLHRNLALANKLLQGRKWSLDSLGVCLCVCVYRELSRIGHHHHLLSTGCCGTAALVPLRNNLNHPEQAFDGRDREPKHQIVLI